MFVTFFFTVHGIWLRLEGIGKTTNNFRKDSSYPAGNQTGYFPNANQTLYPYAKPLGTTK